MKRKRKHQPATLPVNGWQRSLTDQHTSCSKTGDHRWPCSCFLYHNILLINSTEDDKLDKGQTLLVKRLLTAILPPLFCELDCEMLKYLISKVRRTNFTWPPKCFLHLLLLQFIVSETIILPTVKFSQSKDECEHYFFQLPNQHSAVSPASSFHFSFSSTCFGCIMRGQSVSAVVSILGSRQMLPGSLYSIDNPRSPCWLDALFLSTANKKHNTLQIPLSKHPRVLTRIGTLLFSMSVLALSLSSLPVQDRGNPRAWTSGNQVCLSSSQWALWKALSSNVMC